MKIKILGCGWYGAHLGLSLLEDGHDVEIREIASEIFAGASGNNPARMHLGAPHYPRSRLTRAFCLEHRDAFMERYGHLTHCVPINIYAIAKDHSWIDYGTYVTIARSEIDIIELYDPAEYGLRNVEGAILVGERHIVIRKAKEFFWNRLKDNVILNCPPGSLEDDGFDMVIDCTFCALDGKNVERYEPCLTMMLEGPDDTSVTIMDGPFPSLYRADDGICSLTSAKYTPFARVKTYQEARSILDNLSKSDVESQGDRMMGLMAGYYPRVRDFRIADYRLAIRAMPTSGADSRLVDIARAGQKAWRVRAGKIDAILHAETEIKRIIAEQYAA